jgi:hypothetical protein
VLVCVVVDEDDQTSQAVLLEAGVAGAGLELLLLGPTGEDDHTPHVSDDEELLVVPEGFTGVELGVVFVLLETTEDDDHTAHVSDDEELLLEMTGERGVEEPIEDVSQLPQDEVAEVVLLIATGEDGVEDAPQLPQEVDGDKEVFAITAEVLEFPSQLPQDEAGVASDAPFPLPQGEACAEAGAVCQLPQLPEAPCLSRLSTTPAMTELTKASRTNELFTILASRR